MTVNSNQIQLKGSFRHEEDRASESITPGHLIEVHTSTGQKVRKHTTAGGFAERAFAIEDALQGNTIDTVYAANDLVLYHLAEPGAEIRAFAKAGGNFAIGDRLISASGGLLKKEADATTAEVVKQIIAIAVEALDLSATAAVNTRLDVRVL